MALKRTERVDWLKTQLKNDDGLSTKPIPINKIQRMLQERFKSDSISAVEACRVLKEAFPSVQQKRLTKQGVKQTYVTGVDWTDQALSTSPSSSSTQASDRATLKQRIELEKPVQGLEQSQHYIRESDKMLSSSDVASHGPDTIWRLAHFSLDSIRQEFAVHTPELFDLFSTIGLNKQQSEAQATLQTGEMKTITSLCVLLNARSNRFRGLQLLISLMLVARGSSKQIMRVLNHAGVCMSYEATWQHIQQLIFEAGYADVVKQGSWIWIYDNLNLMRKVRHERSDTHPEMLSVTSRLAVKVKYIPSREVDWNDTTPQKSRSELTIDDLIPNEADGEEMFVRAVQYVMRFMVTHFKAFAHLKNKVLPLKSPHPVKKSEVAPLKILDKDEKYTQANIEILESFKKDAHLTCNPQIFVGDQLTCKNIRGAKLWRAPEINLENRLQWANETPGDFHFLWEAQRVLLQSFWGNPRIPGSLSNLRQQIDRLGVDQKGKVFSVGDEFIIHAFQGHLSVSICEKLGLGSLDCPMPPSETEVTIEWLTETAKSIVECTIMPADSIRQDPVYALHRAFMHGAFIYADLRNAIKYEDGNQIIRLWKHWLVYFLGTGRKNYSVEAINLLRNLSCDYPAHIAYIVKHNRCVNMTGIEGRGKPMDQLIEHYNLMIKQMMRQSGANATHKHLQEVSLCAMLLMDAAKEVDNMFGVRQSVSHTTRQAVTDISKIVTYLQAEKVTKNDDERTGVPFTDPRIAGSGKIAKGVLEAYLRGEIEIDEQACEDIGDDDIDINYELYDIQ